MFDFDEDIHSFEANGLDVLEVHSDEQVVLDNDGPYVQALGLDSFPSLVEEAKIPEGVLKLH